MSKNSCSKVEGGRGRRTCVLSMDNLIIGISSRVAKKEEIYFKDGASPMQFSDVLVFKIHLYSSYLTCFGIFRQLKWFFLNQLIGSFNVWCGVVV